MARDARQRFVAFVSLGPTASGGVKRETVGAITRTVADSFDPEFGGLGTSPGSKFADAESIRLALAQAFLTGNDGLKRKALHTLEAYALSGMRDHVNGGFFR